ncbi:response regulator transcription factor [Paraburkholderia guartelaensis]|uniref:Response regulator transcription factor n=1 Tax=Paraburkholderia guartelaensis TaxID=2546446 RepID=A0A4R5L3C8_9BURK|nr:response regulator [Paraburkholderia guartelaensis]TDG02305.1 response regulator transcription factor [Paraburkholderia guartelaensis]
MKDVYPPICQGDGFPYRAFSPGNRGEAADTSVASNTAIVFVVDDDEHVRNALSRLLRSCGYNVHAFDCASAFFQGADLTHAPACLLLDLKLPDLSGIELQRRLDGVVPIVFISAHGDLNTAVEAMKAGATDFLEKPVDASVLLDATQRALERARRLFDERERRDEVQRRVDTLTRREREVMALVVTGRPNKVVADTLGAAEKTIKIHRARMMAKMEVRTLPDLVRLVAMADLEAPEPPMRHLSTLAR